MESIEKDARLKDQLTGAQAADVTEARTHREAATRAVRTRMNHVFYPEKSETQASPSTCTRLSSPLAGVPRSERSTARRSPTVWSSRGLAPSAFGWPFKPIWAEDRPHLPIAEAAEWFASYVYMPKTRDRVVLDAAIKDAVSQLTPKFGYADRFDDDAQRYVGLAHGRRLLLNFCRQRPCLCPRRLRGASNVCAGTRRRPDRAGSNDIEHRLLDRRQC